MTPQMRALVEALSNYPYSASQNAPPLQPVEEAFLGAVVGSGLTILAQWFLGPRIERRVRAQERWEQFLVEFASLIEGPVKRAHDAARSAWIGWNALRDVAAGSPDVDPDRIQELNEGDRAAFRGALDAWGDTLVRPDWLAKRISGDYSLADDEVRRFYTRWSFYRFEQLRWNVWDEYPTEDPSAWERAADARKTLLDHVEILSLRIGAPVGLLQRIRARRRRSRERRAAAERSQFNRPDPDS